jgi:type I restriction enzyme S subunit
MVPLPLIEEQKAIAQVLNTCDQEILLTKKKLELLKLQKKGLMQRLLTGDVRVSV